PPRSPLEHVLHDVDARGLAHDPSGGAKGARGEGAAVRGAMRELDALPLAEEVDRMLAHHVPAPERQNADLLGGARTHLALAAVAAILRKVAAEGAGHRLGEPKRRPRRRIL